MLFDPDKGETRSMRSKEDAHDYRYFPDPDLLPLVIDDAWIERVGRMPELPRRCRRAFRAIRPTRYDAAGLTSSKALAAYFEALVEKAGARRRKSRRTG